MDLIKYVNNKQLKSKVFKIKPGNIVAVHQRIREGSKERVQVFKGIVIRVKGGYGIDGSFTVRKIASGVGVEKGFMFNSPLIEKIEVIKQAKVRRSKLYYLRGRFGKSARLNLVGDDKGVEELIREVIGEESSGKELSVDGQDSSESQNEKDGKKEVESVEKKNVKVDNNKEEPKKEEKAEIESKKTEKEVKAEKKEEKKDDIKKVNGSKEDVKEVKVEKKDDVKKEEESNKEEK